ncbi:unnamed protein product [Brachionus calyciflorus]|uniref:Glutaredoxin domain-containing protein n=1 Tax=Brachionus calyciflorus TaxID=104777 RepID=A0A813SZ57_9BILA|nr:unnamed protein product [Brachionus calyciflorus]
MSTIYSKNSLRFLKNVFFSSGFKLHKNSLVSLSNPKIKFFDYQKLFRSQQRFKTSSSQFKNTISNGLSYLVTVSIGLSGGLFTGYFLVRDTSTNLNDPNEDIRPVKLISNFKSTKHIEHKDSAYNKFPLKIHLYQYENCPYCFQVRAYLDYFGFSYTLTEVDSLTKQELTKFTRAKILPIIVIEDKINKNKWHLANATNILSALESIRNEKHYNFKKVLDDYLPVLKESGAINPNKYNVHNSDLNSIEWRKWINNTAIPIFNLNSINNLKDLYEKFDHISEKSGWETRYNKLKYYYVYYYNVFKTYKRLPAMLNRLDPEDRHRAPRELLDKVVSKWEEGLDNKQFLSGTNKPNLADLSMYGNVKTYEGCAVFREAIAKYPKFRKWYEQMNLTVSKGYQQIDKKSIAYLIDSLDDDLEENKRRKKEISEVKDDKPNLVTEAPKPEKVPEDTQSYSKKNNDKLMFRILSANYLIHVFAFAYASYMNK